MADKYVIKLNIFEYGKLYESTIIDVEFESERECVDSLSASGYEYIDGKLTLVNGETTSIAEIELIN